MKFIADPVYVDDNADFDEIMDACLRAKWRRAYTLEDRMSRTDLSGKCGSCKHFNLKEDSKTCGHCPMRGRRERTSRACKEYERGNDEN